MGYYVGLDVSMATTSVCVEDERGQIVLERTVETQPEVIAKTLHSLDGCIEVVGLETGSLSHWLTRSLIELGLPAKSVCARVMAAILSTRPNKTDRNDARGIAQAMRCGNYKEVHTKSKAALDVKGLLRARSLLVKTKTQITNTVRGILKSSGIRMPRGNGESFFETLDHILEALPCEMKIGLAALLETLRSVLDQLRILDAKVKAMARERAESKLLMTIPGIGPITALSFLAEIDDPNRFDESSKVGAYLGMTPTQYQSGEVNRYGGISRCGPKDLRQLLNEAAIVLLTRTSSWSRLKSWGVRLMAKKGAKKAAMAVGRKLSVIMHRMLITGQSFAFTTKQNAELQAV